jgi:uncharacterized protein
MRGRGGIICVIHLTNRCNLHCVYCYKNVHSYDTEKKLAKPRDLLSSDLSRFADWVIASSRDPILFQFHGGEPTLAWPTLTRFVDEVKRRPDFNPRRIRFGLQTNCLDVDREKINWASSNGVNISVSFDGLPEVQNVNRPRADGKGSYDQVAGNLSLLCEGPNGAYIQTTVLNYDKLAQGFWHCVALGAREIVLSPAYDTRTMYNESWGREFANAHLALALNLLEKNLERPTAVEATLARLLRNWYVPESNRKFMCNAWPCGAGSRLVSLDVDGQVYPCDEFFDYEEWSYSHVTELCGQDFDQLLTHSDVGRRIGSRHYENIESCANCPAREACGGGCSGVVWRCRGTLQAPDPHCAYYRNLVSGLVDLVDKDQMAIPMLVDPWIARR